MGTGMAGLTVCSHLWTQGRAYSVPGPLLLDDPKPYLHDGVEVLLHPARAEVCYMLVENLAEK